MISLYALHHLCAFVIGACLGSFLVVAILRLPEDRSIWSPPSACPVCRTPIRWRDNIPVLAWLELQGRCRTCHTSISLFYPLVELLMGLVAWLLYARLVPRGAELDPGHVATFVLYLTFSWLLLLAAFTDLRTRIIPELASTWAVPIGLFGVFVVNTLGTTGLLVPDWRLAAMGAGGAYALFWMLSRGWRLVFGQEGFALGDVKLVAMVAAFVGPMPGAWWVVLIASFIAAGTGIIAVVAARRRTYLPFAPSLAIAGITYVLYAEDLLALWGERLARMGLLLLG